MFCLVCLPMIQIAHKGATVQSGKAFSICALFRCNEVLPFCKDSCCGLSGRFSVSFYHPLYHWLQSKTQAVQLYTCWTQNETVTCLKKHFFTLKLFFFVIGCTDFPSPLGGRPENDPRKVWCWADLYLFY